VDGPGGMSRTGRPPLDTSAPPVVIVGLDNITGLQTARILRARGIPVFGVVADERHWAARTNTCLEVLRCSLDDDELVETLLALAGRLGTPAVLMPCTDAAVQTLSRHRAALGGHFLLPPGSPHTIEMLADKARFAEYATKAGLPVPRTEVLRTRSDAADVAPELRYPCVLKPSVKTAGWRTHGGVKGFKVEDVDEFLRTYDEVASWASVLLAQEWVPGARGEQFTCNAYFGEGGRPLAAFVTRKLRQWPPDVGTGASGVECRNDQVLAATLRLFGELRYRGFGYLEMKRDARTGQMVIIEPNVGRPTGRSATAEAAGVELIYTGYCDVVGRPLPSDRRQLYTGARWLDLRRDLQAAVVAHRQGELRFSDWLRWVHGAEAHAIWSSHDPLPFMVDVARASGTAARMVLRRKANRLVDRDERVLRQMDEANAS
jgi:D-aspartate ligase